MALDFDFDPSSEFMVQSIPGPEKLNTLIGNSSFNILHLNIRSVLKNFDQLVVHLQTYQVPIHVIVLTEAWLANDKLLQISLPGYDMHASSCRLNRASGIVIFTFAAVKTVTVAPVYLTCDSFIIECNLSCQTSLVVIAIYRSPAFSDDSFLLQFNDELNLYNDKDVLLLGDFNFDLLSLSPTDATLEYLHILFRHRLIQLVNVPSHVDLSFSTCIDHVIVPFNSRYNFQAFVLEANVTDHFPLFVSYFVNCSDLNIDQQPCKAVINNTLASNLVSNLDLSYLDLDLSVEFSFNVFLSSVLHVIDESSTLISSVKKTRKLKPWITTDLIHLINRRDKMAYKARKNPLDFSLQRSYRRFRNFVVGKIRKQKLNYFSFQFLNKKNLRDQWSLVNEITGFRNKPFVLPSCTNLAITFNNYFGNCCTISSSILGTSSFQCLSDPNPFSFFLFPPCYNEVCSCILALKQCSPGWDNIRSSFVKQNLDFFCFVLTALITNSFAHGHVPSMLKIARVIPIFKSGNKEDVGNYRPISLLTTFSKVFEGIMKIRLMSFLNKFKILHPNQFGFQSGKSTEHAISKLLTLVINSMNAHYCPLVIFFDFKKAFDSVSHFVLIKKLEHYGIRGTALKWFKSYLQNREQFVDVKGSKSSNIVIKCGVPQGSILGPILFLIYVNDVFSLPLKGTLIGYADDLALVFSNSDSQNYNDAIHDLKILKKWFQTNLLTVNIKKTVCMRFGFSKCNMQPIKFHNFSCLFDNCSCPVFNFVAKYKYLGILLDNHLSWAPHIVSVTQKLRYIGIMLQPLRFILPFKFLKTTYIGLYQSVLQYGLIFWGGAYKSHINHLQIFHNRFLRMLFINEINFSNLNIFTLHKLYLFKLGCYGLKYIRDFPTVNFDYNTRSSCHVKFRIPTTKYTFMFHQFLVIVVYFLNYLPTDLIKESCHAKQKLLLKNWLFTSEQPNNFVVSDLYCSLDYFL